MALDIILPYYEVARVNALNIYRGKKNYTMVNRRNF